MFPLKVIAVLLSLLAATLLTAQKENNIWYFGNKVGLSFSSGSPTVLTDSKMNTREGCSSVSDKDGNLLFYTDGITVWNGTHAVMSNGTGLKGNGSSTQSSVVVKKPGSQYEYYIFNPDCWEAATGGIHYSLVDMSENSGLGEVTVKNKRLVSGKFTEKIACVKKNSGCGFWILTPQEDKLYTFSLTVAGIDSTPIVSALEKNVSSLGYLKASPDGKKLAMANYNDASIELYNFNDNTGKVTDGFVLDSTYAVYGCSFSPNNNLLYVGSFSKNHLYQFDVSLPTAAAIKASKITIYQYPTGNIFGALQIGPDRKIYVTKENERHLGVINNPDVKGMGCNYTDSGILMTTNNQQRVQKLGLPNFIDNASPFSISLSLGPDIKYCYNSAFTIGPQGSLNGNFTWSTGEKTQTITKNQPGTYWLKAEITCGTTVNSVSDTIKVFSVTDSAALHIGHDTIICGKTLSLYTSKKPDVSYEWFNGSMDTSVIVATSGKYWLKTTSVCGEKRDTVNVTIIKDPIPPVNLGNDTALCATTIQLKTTPLNNVKYLWSSGDTTPGINATTTGTYWVKVSNYCETKTDTVLLTLKTLLPVNLGKDTLFCGTLLTLSPATMQNASYLWNTGDTTPSIKVTAAGTYWLSVFNDCDIKTDTVKVDFITDITGIDIGNDTSLCTGNVVLDAGVIRGARYKWSTGDTAQAITVLQKGRYKLRVTTVCNTVFEDSAYVAFFEAKPVYLGNDTTVCRENFKELVLMPKTVYKNYMWNDGSQTPAIIATDEGIYTLAATDTCGNTFTDSILLTICGCQLDVPNAFTPGKDGLNDVFSIGNDCGLMLFTIRIFSRWGELMYESADAQKGWDGTFKGKPVPADVYFVMINYSYTNMVREAYTGTVTVLR